MHEMSFQLDKNSEFLTSQGQLFFEHKDGYFQIDVRCSDPLPFIKGRTDLLPEDCFPDEGGYCEDVFVLYKNTDITGLVTEEFLNLASDIVVEQANLMSIDYDAC
jgi:hypothetical protein